MDAAPPVPLEEAPERPALALPLRAVSLASALASSSTTAVSTAKVLFASLAGLAALDPLAPNLSS